MSDRRRVAYLIGFSAPPVLHLDEFIRLLTSEGWDTYVILSPTAATWIDVNTLAQVSGHPVRVKQRLPHEQDPLPPAAAVIAAPITFNSLNKCAMGISDTLALGLLNESLGQSTRVTIAPCAKTALKHHPAYQQSVRLLTAAGATILEPFEATQQVNRISLLAEWSRIAPT